MTCIVHSYSYSYVPYSKEENFEQVRGPNLNFNEFNFIHYDEFEINSPHVYVRALAFDTGSVPCVTDISFSVEDVVKGYHLCSPP